MKAIILANSSAGSSNQDTLQKCAEMLSCEIIWTTSAEHGLQEARESSFEYEVLLIAGGDGTIHNCLNGVAQGNTNVNIGLLPMGTGNDLCRSLDVPLDPMDALKLISPNASTVSIDVWRLQHDHGDDFMYNVSAGGFSGSLDKYLEQTNKSLWQTLSYLKSGIQALKDVEPFVIDVKIESETLVYTVLNFALANGKFAGAGVPVSPESHLNDAKVELVMYLGKNVADQIGNLPSIWTGNHIFEENIEVISATSLELEFSRPIPMNIDGDLIENPVSKVRMTPFKNRLDIICSPDVKSV